MSQRSINSGKQTSHRKDKNQKPPSEREIKKTHNVKSQNDLNPPAKHEPAKSTNQILLKDRVSQSQIEKMLIQHGEFPDKHRFIIWKTLLQVPENKILFEQLLKKGEHPSLEYLKSKFPLKDPVLSQDFQRVLSAIGFWSPVIIESDFIPAVVFPFVKLSRGDLLGAFELSLSLIWNWMQDWFENFPNAPIRYLIRVEDLIASEDKELVSHLHALKLTASTYIWPILKYLFTQVMTREEVSVLIDHVLTFNSKPEFLEALAAAYVLYYASTLKALRNQQDLQGFFTQQNPLVIKKLLAKAQGLMGKVQKTPHRLPLVDGYPSFTNYPDFALSHQILVREKLVQQDQEIQSRKRYIKSINEKFQHLEESEYKLRREQEALIQSEVDRRKDLISSELSKIEERKKIDEETRRIRLSQIQRVEDTIQTSLKNAETLKALNQNSRAEELQALSKYDSYLLAADSENENLSLLEFKAAQRLLELMRVRTAEESNRKLKQHSENWDREQDEKEKVLKKQWQIENEQRRIDLEMIREANIKEMNLTKEYNHKRRMDAQQRLKTLERELKLVELEKEKKLRILAEEELMRNEEYLMQIKVKQELAREQDERQFQVLLLQEKEFRSRKNEELVRQIKEEQRKQSLELERAREENERIERELENQAVHDKVNEMRREAELLEYEREKIVQETIEKIEKERKETRRVEQEINRKRSEIKERNEFQKVVRDTVDEAIQKEREHFWKFREQVEQENDKLEEERKRVYERKMNEIVKQREETLAELSRPVQKVAASLKDRIQDIRVYSDEESEHRHSDHEESQEYYPHDPGFRFNQYRNSDDQESDKGLKVKESYPSFNYEKSGNQKSEYESLSSSGRQGFDYDRQLYTNKPVQQNEPEEDQVYEVKSKNFNFNLKPSENSGVFNSSSKTRGFEYPLIQNKPNDEDYRTKKLISSPESPDKQASSYHVSEGSEDEYSDEDSPQGPKGSQGYRGPLGPLGALGGLNSKGPQSSQGSQGAPASKQSQNANQNLKQNPNLLNYEPETIKSQELFDMQKISEFTKDMKTKKDPVFSIKPSNNFIESMKKIEEEPSYSRESESSGHFRPDRRRWEENSYSKCSSHSAESSDLSYHKLEIPKENKFFISKTQKPDVDYSERWDEGSESFSSCQSHECSSCVYSSSECSCDYSSKESSQRFVSPGYQYSSSDCSSESYVRRSSKT